VSSLSIRARLTLLYAGSVLLVLVVASFGLRVVLRDGLEREFRRAQLATIALVQNQFVVELEEYPTVDSAAVHLVGEVLFPDRLVALLDPDGQPAISPRRRTEVSLGNPVRVLEAPLNPTLAPGWTVRVTFSVTGLDRSTRRLDRGLALGILASAFLAGLMGQRNPSFAAPPRRRFRRRTGPAGRGLQRPARPVGAGVGPAAPVSCRRGARAPDPDRTGPLPTRAGRTARRRSIPPSRRAGPYGSPSA